MISGCLIALAIMGGCGVIGANIQAFRVLNDRDEFHQVGMRCGLYAIGTALALGFLGLAK
jgi:hypothetical protein